MNLSDSSSSNHKIKSGTAAEFHVPTHLVVEDLRIYYHTPNGPVRAVDGVSFELKEGQRLGIVGESGSGKSTIALSLLASHTAPAKVEGGSIHLNGVDILALDEDDVRQKRLSEISMVPQGALNSLNPVLRVRDQLLDGLKDHGVALNRQEARKKVETLLESTGLPPEVAKMYPHELSGGMKQRVAIAIAISMNPKVIVADEPTSALDVVVQRRIIQTLMAIQQKLKASIILIGHDMGLMAKFATHIAIMYGGKMVEMGTTRDIFENTLHPYTKLLISSLPHTYGKQKMEGIPGLPPSLLNPPSGCVFHPRCPNVMQRCKDLVPSLKPIEPGHVTACHIYESGTVSTGKVEVQNA